MSRAVARLCVTFAALLASVSSFACSGHGKRTTEALEEAQTNIASIRAGTQYDQARRLYLNGDFESAIEAVDSSIEFKEDVPDSHLLRARILIETGEHAEARSALEKGLELDPTNAEFPYLRGVIHEQLGMLISAQEDYAQALSIDADDPAARLALAEVLVQLERVQDAKDLLAASSGWSSGEGGFRQCLGHIALLENDEEEALRLFSEAAILNPSDAGILEDLFRAQVNAQLFEEGLTTVRHIEQTDVYEKRADLRRMHALCLVQVRDPVRARTILKDLTAGIDGARDFEAWQLMADVALLLDDDRLLHQSADRMVQAAPTRAEGFVAQAMSRRRAGDLEGALASARLALVRSSEDSTAARLEELLEADLAARAN